MEDPEVGEPLCRRPSNQQLAASSGVVPLGKKPRQGSGTDSIMVSKRQQLSRQTQEQRPSLPSRRGWRFGFFFFRSALALPLSLHRNSGTVVTSLRDTPYLGRWRVVAEEVESFAPPVAEEDGDFLGVLPEFIYTFERTSADVISRSEQINMTVTQLFSFHPERKRGVKRSYNSGWSEDHHHHHFINLVNILYLSV